MKRALFYIFLVFILSIISLFSISGVNAINYSNSLIVSYSMENLPDTFVSDYSANNDPAALTDYVNMIDNSAPKIGDWSLKTNYSANDIADNYYMNTNISIRTNTEHSISLWVKLEKPTGDNPLVTYGNLRGAHVTLYQLSSGRLELDLDEANGGDQACDGKRINMLSNTNAFTSYGNWTHIVALFNRTGNTSATGNFYVNGAAVSSISYGSTTSGAIPTYNSYGFIKIGADPTGTSCATHFGSANNNATNIDQLMIWNRTIDTSEIAGLYNAGVGYDPFDTTIPTQIASISPVAIVFNGYSSREFGQYFIDDTYTELAFDYGNASYDLTYSGIDTANLGTFAVGFTDSTTISFWGFNDVVPTFNMSVRGCNAYGCSAWDNQFFFSVGYNGSGAYQIASIAPISLPTNTIVSRTFSNYFSGYTNRFLQFTNPTNLSIEYVATGFPANNSCVYMEISGDNLLISSKNNSCVLSGVYFIVDDNTTTVTSNLLTISVQGTTGNFTTGSFGAGVGGVVNLFGGLFPDSDTLTNQTKFTYVVLVMLVTLMIGAFVIINSSSGAFTSIGVGVVLLMEFVYFTSIGYVPILWIALFVVIVVILGIGYFTKQSAGSGG
jgi:hypothetical protein